MAQGVATAEDTRMHGEKYFSRGYAPDTFRLLGRTGLTVSSIGFGGRGVHVSDVRNQSALREALYSGCNLVDTAAHYAGGDSEQLVGHVLSQCDGLPRASIVLSTKLGAFAGQDLAWLRAQSGADTTCFREDSQLWRSYHPDRLEGQLHRSLSRLSLDAVDILLLDSPEFLFDIAMSSAPSASDEEHYVFVYDALTAAFTRLESMVRLGLISWYGVSSEALSAGESGQLTIDVQRLWDCAVRAGGEQHHFAVVQMSKSVLGLRLSDIEQVQSLQSLVSSLDLGVLAGRSLQSVVDGRLVRLTDYDTEGTARIGRLAKTAASLEAEFAEGLGRAFEMEGMDKDARLFDNTERLLEVAASLDDYVLWREFVEDVLEQELSGLIGQIDAGLSGPLKVAWTFWLERYIKAISLLVDGLTLRCARTSQKQSHRLAKWLRPMVPDAPKGAGLAQLSLVIVRDLPGVHSVLVGMRRIQYAIDAMETMHWPVQNQQSKHVATVAQKFANGGAS